MNPQVEPRKENKGMDSRNRCSGCIYCVVLECLWIQFGHDSEPTQVHADCCMEKSLLQRSRRCDGTGTDLRAKLQTASRGRRHRKLPEKLLSAHNLASLLISGVCLYGIRLHRM